MIFSKIQMVFWKRSIDYDYFIKTEEGNGDGNANKEIRFREKKQ